MSSTRKVIGEPVSLTAWTRAPSNAIPANAAEECMPKKTVPESQALSRGTFPLTKAPLKETPASDDPSEVPFRLSPFRLSPFRLSPLLNTAACDRGLSRASGPAPQPSRKGRMQIARASRDIVGPPGREE